MPLLLLFLLGLILQSNYGVLAINQSHKLELRCCPGGPPVSFGPNYHITCVERMPNVILDLRGGSSETSTASRASEVVRIIRPSSKRSSGYTFVIGMLTGMLIRELDFARMKGSKAAEKVFEACGLVSGLLYLIKIFGLDTHNWGPYLNPMKRMVPPWTIFVCAYVGICTGMMTGMKYDSIPVNELKAAGPYGKGSIQLEELLLYAGLVGPILAIYLMANEIHTIYSIVAHGLADVCILLVALGTLWYFFEHLANAY